MAGGILKNNRGIHRLSLKKKLLVAAAAFAAVAGPMVLGIASAPRLHAQSAAPLAFEVASIRPSILPAGSFFIKKPLPTSDVPFRISGNRVITPRRTVTDLILAAYDVKDFQISGAPSWASQAGDRYDIEAKASGDTAPTVEQFRLMFQSLLADRFRLKLHRDSKQLPAYDLVIGKNGSKLKPIPPDAPLPRSFVPRSPDQIAWQLSWVLDLPVIDKTGLSGTFEYTLDWGELFKAQREDPYGFATGTLSSALENNLGLKLTSAKEKVEILVIDHVERPGEN
jgi:bla regulator protein BlaR1